jgi:iron(III) transport system ATP-binding protein
VSKLLPLRQVRQAPHALFLLLLLTLAGCGGARTPSLAVREVHHWPLPPDGSALPAPRSVAFTAKGECLVLDRAARVLVFDERGTPLRQWAMPDASVGKPEGICALADGRIIVCDTHYHRLVYFDANGNVLAKLGRMGTGPGEFIYPVGIAKDAQENLYVCEYGSNDRVQKFTREGKFLLAFGRFGTGAGEFQRPSGLAWADGKIYAADAINNRVLVFTDAGKFVGLLGAPGKPLFFDLPYGVAVGADGALYVIEYGSGKLSRVSLDGALLGTFGSPGAGERQFASPWGLAVDRKMRLWVADTGNRRMVDIQL